MTKILIAEDENDIRELIKLTLQFNGFDVTTAYDGQNAVELAGTADFDLIMMDVRMPRLTGYEACEVLKADPKTKDIPIIFLSAKGQESEIAIGKEVGAAGYLLKPFAPDQLVKKIREILA